MKSFEELALSAPLKQAIAELGFTTPSPIQQQALPLLLGEATDFIGLAATGTGKTAAFGIPMLEQIDPTLKAVQALILCPTRELALQVAGQIDLLGKHLKVRALPIYGGARYDDQIFGLKNGAKIVVGTPGRIIDHLDRGTLKLDNLKTLILDEADEMISMGFKEDLERVLESSPRETANIWLFSATMSREVRKVADTYLRKPKLAEINRTEMLSENVEQIFYPTKESDKPEVLCKLIEAADDFYGVIFCQTKSLVMDLTHFLTSRGYKVDSLHGDKDQKARERTMLAFRNRKVNMLVCTDVAARGLDVKDVSHVINYSIPRELDSYVHRIGRTARSGKSGFAMSLVTPANRQMIAKIEKMTKSKIKEGRVPSRRDIGAIKVGKILSKFQEQKYYQRAMEHVNGDWHDVVSGMSVEEVIGRFLSLSSPDIFNDLDQPKTRLINTSNSAREGGGRRDTGGRRPQNGGRRRERGDSRGRRGENRGENRSEGFEAAGAYKDRPIFDIEAFESREAGSKRADKSRARRRRSEGHKMKTLGSGKRKPTQQEQRV